MEPHEIQAILDHENRPIMENDKILIFNKTEGNLQYLKANKELEDLLSLSRSDYPADGLTTQTDEPLEKFQWSHASTLLLIDEFKQIYHKFRDPKIKKKTLWEKISKTMQQQGYAVDPDILDKKIRNMKKTYRTILDNNNKKKRTGTGRISWPYFELFQEIFHDDSAVNLPSGIICSTEAIESSHDENSSCNSSVSTPQGASSPLLNPQSSLIKEAGSLSACSTSTYEGTPSKPSKMEKYRKRQLEIEEEKLSHLKEICTAIKQSNEIQKEKLAVLKQLAASRQN